MKVCTLSQNKFKMKLFIVTLTFFHAFGVIQCCSTTKDCSIIDSTCSEGKCVCNKGYYLNVDKSKCLPYVTEYLGECSEDAQCEWLGENSECRYSCTCKEGYRWYLGKCLKYVGLGEKCSTSQDCYDGYNPLSLKCYQGICQCNDGYYKRGNTDCRKIANKNEICAIDMDCKDDNQICILGKCSKPKKSLMIEEQIEDTSYYHTISNKKTCNKQEDCSDIPNSECYEKTGTCICKHSYFFNPTGTKCLPEVGVESKCKQDSDCKIRPGKCVDGVCYCRDYYFLEDGNRNCIKTISQNNWNCLSREWCFALGTYSYCSSAGTCKCSKIANMDKENMLCKWNGNEDPDLCKSDFDCKYIEGGYCIDESCGCLENHDLLDGKCVPNIGAPCDNGENACLIQNSKCIDNICQCVKGYVASENRCYEIKYDLGSNCVIDLQCSIGKKYTKCINSTCQCNENYLAYNSECYQKKEPNSYCNNRLECTISLKDQFVCRNSKCQCPTGLNLKGNECSKGSVNNRSLIFFVSVMILNIVHIFC